MTKAYDIPPEVESIPPTIPARYYDEGFFKPWTREEVAVRYYPLESSRRQCGFTVQVFENVPILEDTSITRGYWRFDCRDHKDFMHKVILPAVRHYKAI